MNIRLKTFFNEICHRVNQRIKMRHKGCVLTICPLYYVYYCRYLCTNDMIVSRTHRCLCHFTSPPFDHFFLSDGGGMIFTTTVTTNFAGSFSSKQTSSFRTLRPVFQESLMMQDHTNILLSEATNHILNSKNSVEMLYDKPGPPYDSAKGDKN